MSKICKIVDGENWVQVGLEEPDAYGNRKIISELRKGYWVTIPTVMGSTEKFTTNIKEAFSWIGRYDNEADDIDRRAKELGAYLSSDEGAWGRGS